VSENVRNQIDARLSLREPQKESLHRLADVLERITLAKDIDLAAALATIRATYPDVSDFERTFPSLCFALATGVGKTRLMGAFVTYLYVTGRSKNFFVLAPNLTIYEKLIKDFTEGSSKYVFKGVAEFARNVPQIVTGDTYQDGRGLRRQGEMFAADCIINIFNISKINSEVRGGHRPRMMRLQEVLGESYFAYLSRLPDLVLLMDEAHRYRATAGVRAINALQPILGLELTATPKDFKNVIYRYGLGDAMADGFVKEPAVATQANFNLGQHDQDSLERLKLEDGVLCHEFTKTRLDLYARRTGRDPVHPFMLVVAESIQHAKELRARIESDSFFDGYYRGKVIEVHSGQGVAERENVERQLVALETDKSTEIVIHVNQLNEGWDVTNLYTIVPLRAFAAAILTEQTLGRGLRLPYGERTGDEVVDRLTIIAHDHFDEIIKRAKEPGAITMREVRIGLGGDIPANGEEIVTAKPTYEANVEAELAAGPGGFGDRERQTLEVTRRVVEEEARRLTAGFRQLESKDAKAAVVARVQAIMQPTQGTLDIGAKVDVERVVETYITNLVKHSIEIPEIVVLPSRKDVTFGFNDFDLAGLDRIGVRPLAGEVIIEDLRTGRREMIKVDTIGAKEPRLENYLVRRLIERDAVDYEQNAELLFKLASQMVTHLRSYLKEPEIEAVLRAHAGMLADFIFDQMMQEGHYWETPTTYEPTVTRGYVPVRELYYEKDRGLPLRDFQEAVTPRGDTRKYLFNGFARCALNTQRFQSDDERRFAVLIDRREAAVKVWLKPGSGVFQITYAHGQKAANYEPDFLIDTETGMLICEVKAANELEDPIVKAKAAATRVWIGAANAVAEGTGRKLWRYALIPHDSISESATLAGLMSTYGQMPAPVGPLFASR